jgi:hypothetical protein
MARPGWGSGARGETAQPSGGRGGWGSGARGERPVRARRRKDDGGRSIGGFLGNLGEDVGGALLGIPGGVREAVTHPVRAGQAVRRSYQQTYGALDEALPRSPLPWFDDDDSEHGTGLRGLSKFGRNVYDHPLGPILDAATVVTLGAGATARGASLLGRAGAAGRVARVELRGPSGTTIPGRTLSRNPVVRGRQRAVDRTLKALPGRTPLVGELARFARELERAPRRDARRLELKLRPYRRAWGKLNEAERIALSLHARAMSPDEYRGLLLREKEAGADVHENMLGLLERTDVRAAFADPSPRLQRTMELAREAGEISAGILKDRGLLDEVAMAERPYLHARLASGAEFRPKGLGRAFEGDPVPMNQEAMFGADVGPVVRQGELGAGALVRTRDRGNVGRVVAWDPETNMGRVHFVNRRTGAEEHVPYHADDLQVITPEEASRAEVELVGGKPIDEIRAALEEMGRPQPFYLPDVDVTKGVSTGKAGGGRGVPTKPGATKQNRAILARMGQLALDVDQLSPSYISAVKFALHSDLHDVLLEHAVPIAKGTGLPDKWSYIRRPVGRSRRGEQIPHTAQVRGEFERDLEDLVPADAEKLSPEDWIAKAEADAAVDADGHYLALPESVIRQVAGEFHRSSNAASKFFNKATSVWRAIVLGYRPAFLVNNLIGNHLLYAIKNAGPAGLRAYVNALRSTKGGEALARKLGSDPETRGLIDDEFLVEFFPEQTEAGAFGSTQRPRFRKPGAQRAARAAGSGIIPATQAIAEGTLRRAAVEKALRTNPQVRARVRAMKGERRKFEKAARQTLLDEPDVVREVSDQVNAALGDYLGLSPFERYVVRSAFPFYAWYRAITVITVKLPLDHPGRADVLAKLGEIGSEIEEEQLGERPSYLGGALPWGDREGDLQGIVTTGGLNPLATPVGLARGLPAVGPGGSPEAAREFVGTMNPLLLEAARQIAAARDGRPLPGGLVAGPLSRVAQSLPPAQLGRGPSDLYPERDWRYQLAALLGVPYKRMSVSEARARAREERER